MTDFFAELEGHLHHAARRRARMRQVPGAALAVSAAAVIAFAGVTALSGDADREVASPVPTPAAVPATDQVSCGDEAIPRVLVDSFSVLRRDRTADDVLPDEVEAVLFADEPPYEPSKAWTADARRVELEHATYWIVPALIGDSCDQPGAVREAGMCVIWGPRHAVATCQSMAEIRKGRMQYGNRAEDGRWFRAVLVPDGYSFHVMVGDRRENGIVVDSIGEKAFQATTDEVNGVIEAFIEPLGG